MRRCHQIWVLTLGGLLSLFLYVCLRKEPLAVSTTSRSSPLILTDGTFTFHLEPRVYEAHFPHLQRYQCREVISRDAFCQGPARAPLLLLAVKSHPAAGTRRATLRRTWAQPAEMGGFRLQPLFLLASTSSDRHHSLLELESRSFGDILMWDFVESHHNLSLKERCFLQWVHRSCQGATYVFKGDDDLFMNPWALTNYLRRTHNAFRFIHGNIQVHSVVGRTGKYAISKDFYPMDRYPNFASGGGFVLPRAALAALYQASLKLPVFPLDDVYLGFLSLAAGVPQRHEESFRVWGIPEDILPAYQQSLTIHGPSMERIEQVWNEFESLKPPKQMGRVGAAP